jgi:hypothetical protein
MILFIKNVRWYNRGSIKIYGIRDDDIIYDGFNNENIIVNNISKKYKKTLELNVYKTRPIQLGYHNKVLTIRDINDEPKWTYIEDLNINHYVAMTTKHLSTIKHDNRDKYLLMGVYIRR